MSDTPRTEAEVNRQKCWSDDLITIDANFACQLERELNAANERIKQLEKATQERDKEWFQVIESILGFHPVSMTEALRIGIERIKKHKQHIKRLEEAGDAMASAWDKEWLTEADIEAIIDDWHKAKESKP